MAKRIILSPLELNTHLCNLSAIGHTHLNLPNHAVLPKHLQGARIRVYQAQKLLELALKMKIIAADLCAEAFALKSGIHVAVYPCNFSFEQLAVFLPQLDSDLFLNDSIELDIDADAFLLALSTAVEQV